MQGFFAIPPGLPLAKILARGVLRQAEDSGTDLADIRIFVPAKRAGQLVREAFLRESGGRVMLLPRILPLGDIDGDELTLLSPALETSLPPACDPMRRAFILTRLLLEQGAASIAEAAALAEALAKFLDETIEEEADLGKLGTLAQGDLAQHWQKTLDLLAIVTESWPKERERLGVLDPAMRRKALIEAQAALWRTDPVSSPVYAVGIFDPSPSYVRIVQAIARLPQGRVLLPLDAGIDPASWETIAASETHPQHDIRTLLDRLNLTRTDVPLWHYAEDAATAATESRRALWREVMRPAETTARWDSLTPDQAPAHGIEGLTRLDLENAEEEAFTAALLMREALETPQRTAALVTPDRTLARRTAAHLLRWGITIDDSAGQPLGLTPEGAFLRLVLDWLRPGAGAVDLLSLFKHPLSAAGLAPAECRTRIRLIERRVLRGPRLAPGLAGVLAALSDLKDKDQDALRLAEWLAEVQEKTAALGAILTAQKTTLKDAIFAHLDLAEALAASDTESGSTRLWRHQAGEAASAAIESALAAAESLPHFPGRDYPDLFVRLIATKAVREPYGQHPRLAILGRIESRFRQYDMLILGGLNEGTWPESASDDPWLSRPMRRDLGLRQPEQALGRSAADFVQAASAPVVYLTRAQRVEGAPTLPSRWLMRLDAVAERMGMRDRFYRPPGWLAKALEIDRPQAQAKAIARPRPAPPISARPRQASVTEVERWLADPYAIYAARILRLTPLDPIDDQPDQRERGTIVHAILATFIKECGLTAAPLPPDARERLLRIGKATFADWHTKPGVAAIWWPRFLAAADWFLDWERDRRQEGWHPIAVEIKGQIEINAPNGPFTLTAKADRIDRANSGDALAILDYKTGTLPAQKAIETASSPQLPLEAIILAEGGFAKAAPAPIAELSYLQLQGTEPPGLFRSWPNEDPDTATIKISELAATCRKDLTALIARFDDPRTAYGAAFSGRGDYAHLARFAEWSAPGEDEGDDS